jgi:Holliday junction resolvase
MINNPNKKCTIKNCNNKAEYGITKTNHCFLHKKLNEISLCERTCIKCNKIDIVNENNICINFCLMDSKYDIYKKYKKRDEENTIKKIIEKFGEPTKYNKTIDTYCGLERPDCIYDFGSHICIIEIDENQHRYYNKDCEIKRMINIISSFGGIPVYFIRYNPHDWKMNGIRKTLRKQNKENVLIKWINFVKEINLNDIKNIANIKYLYYDNYDNNDKTFKLLEYECRG